MVQHGPRIISVVLLLGVMGSFLVAMWGVVAGDSSCMKGELGLSALWQLSSSRLLM